MSTKHLTYLDSLRGVACISVVVMHTMMYIYPNFKEGNYSGPSINYNNFLFYPPFGILIAGHAAVCLFFVLSGFVLSYRFIGESGMNRKIVEAIIKRPVRLIGAITASLLYMLDFILTAKFWTGAGDFDYYMNCLRRVHYVFFCQFGDTSMSNPPLWTIKVELWGSGLVFVLCLLTGSLPKMLRVALLCLLALCLKNTYYVAFIIGMIIVDLYKNWNSTCFIRYKDTFSYVILIPAVICCSYPYYLHQPHQYWPNTGIIQSGYPMIGAILLFIFVICNAMLKKLLDLKALVFIGSISYSIYVMHNVLLIGQGDNVISFVYKHISTNIYLSFVIIMTIGLTATIFISWLVDKWVDKPCIRLSTWFAKKLVEEIMRHRAFVAAGNAARFIRSKFVPVIDVAKCDNPTTEN